MNALNIQTAIYTRLSTQLTTPVYDDVPQGSEYPYTVIGDDTSIAWDGDTFLGAESTLTMHTWSRYSGRSEVKQIMADIYSALHRHDLVIQDAHTVTCEWEFEETFLEADGETRHGVQRFRVISTAVDSTP